MRNLITDVPGLKIGHAEDAKLGSGATAIIFDAPGHLSFKQMADGSIVGTDSLEPPDIPAHHDIRDHPIAFPDDSLRAMHGDRILAKIAAVLPAARGVGLQRLTLGFRPMPLDELPVVGAIPDVPNLYVVVTHSGVTLAPILGRYVTQEVMSGSRIEALAPFRPERCGPGFTQVRSGQALWALRGPGWRGWPRPPPGDVRGALCGPPARPGEPRGGQQG